MIFPGEMTGYVRERHPEEGKDSPCVSEASAAFRPSLMKYLDSREHASVFCREKGRNRNRQQADADGSMMAEL